MNECYLCRINIDFASYFVTNLDISRLIFLSRGKERKLKTAKNEPQNAMNVVKNKEKFYCYVFFFFSVDEIHA